MSFSTVVPSTPWGTCNPGWELLAQKMVVILCHCQQQITKMSCQNMSHWKECKNPWHVSPLHSLLQDAESKSETSQAISAREHFVFTDTDGQVYHITVEGNTVKDGARIPPDVSPETMCLLFMSLLLQGHPHWSLHKDIPSPFRSLIQFHILLNLYVQKDLNLSFPFPDYFLCLIPVTTSASDFVLSSLCIYLICQIY